MSGKSYLLDASALLAAIHNELGGDLVQQIIEESVVSSVIRLRLNHLVCHWQTELVWRQEDVLS